MTRSIPTAGPAGGLAGLCLGLGVIVALSAASLGAGYGLARGIHGALKTLERPAAPAAAREPQYAPLFAGWPGERPDLVLVLSGEMHGYLRPCGCSPGQQGGLARRGGLLDFLREEKQWDALPLDLGDLVGKSSPLEADRYAYALESLQKLGYAAVGVGPEDLRISLGAILGQAINLKGTKLVEANLTHVEEDVQALLAESIPPMTIAERGGVKVAIGAVMGDPPPGGLADKSAKVEPAGEAAGKLLDAMAAAKPDLKVLLAMMPVQEADKLAAARPGFDLILCQSRLEDSLVQEAHLVGSTMVTWVGRKGKSVGIVGFWKSGEPRLRFELVPLDQRFAEDPEMNEVYARFIQAVKAGGYVEKAAKTPLLDGEAYVGAARCGECHPRAYAKWRGTRHAHALESLQKAQPPGQDFNPECVQCHTTGFEYATGFVTRDKTPHLVGNQCENCHGPGKRHSDDPKNKEWATAMRLSRNTVKQTCITCHDSDNSIHFQFETYWPKVEHPWID